MICLLAPLHAQEKNTLDVRLQQSSGSFGFDIGLPGEQTISRLDYDLDGMLLELSAVLRIPDAKEFSVRGSISQSLSMDGTATDYDWDDNRDLLYLSKAESEVDFSRGRLDVVWEREADDGWLFGAEAGYLFESYDTETSNLRSLIFEGEPENVRVPGAISIYDMEMDGIRLGAMLGRRDDKFNWYIRAGYLPDLNASADAFWILRNYPFVQDAEGMASRSRFCSNTT